MKIKLYLTVAVIVIFNSFCRAQNYELGYNPNTTATLYLGAGFAIDSPLEPKYDPLLTQPLTTVIDTNIITNFSYSIISNDASLEQSSGISGYLAVDDLAYNASASFDLDQSSFYNSSSVTLAIQASTDYGTWRIVSPTLDSFPQRLIDSGDYTAFVNNCGDNFVSEVEKGISFTAYITISNLSQTTQNSLSGDIQVGGGGVTAEGTWNNALNSASASGSIAVEISVKGAAYSQLQGIITTLCANTNAIDAIQDSISSFLGRFTMADAQITEFYYSPMSILPGVPSSINNTISTSKVNKLAAIYDSYYDILGQQSLLNYITTFIPGGSGSSANYYHDFHNYGDALEATRLTSQLDSAVASLNNAYYACKKNPCSDLNTCCNDPAPKIEQDFFNKFILYPFTSCIDATWSEQYANKTFTFTTNSNYNSYPWGVGAYFFDCATTNPILAGNNVNVTVNGTIWNPGTACGGVNGSYCPQLGLTIYTLNGDPYTYWDINNCGSHYGDAYPSLSVNNTIGADGNITTIFYFNTIDQCSAQHLNLSNTTLAISLPNLDTTGTLDAIITPAQATICQGDSITLTANTCKGCSYLWNTGDTTQNISVKDSGNYTVTESDSSGSFNSYWSIITVNQPPMIPTITTASGSIASDSITICQDSSITANSVGCSGCTYTWSPGGQTGSSINVTSGGVYSVTASNGCLPNATSQTAITIIQPPAIPVITTSNGYTTICSGSSITANSSGCVGCTYTWSPATGLSATAGSSVTVTSDGTYTVTASNGYGCPPSETSIPITIDQPNATFTVYGNPYYYLKANNNSDSTYQWFYNDDTVKGATKSIYPYKHDSTGFYRLDITDEYGCSAKSKDTLLSGINVLSSLSQQINIYPNPTNGILFINAPLFQNETVLVSVINVLGQVVLSPEPLQLKGKNSNLDISMLPADIYYLQFKTESGNIMKKFVRE